MKLDCYLAIAQLWIFVVTWNFESESTDILFLSVKPQYLMGVLEGISDHFRPTQIIVSIVGGVLLSQISDVIGEKKICRVMPNTPCLVSEGWSINDSTYFCASWFCSLVDRRVVSLWFSKALPPFVATLR